MNKSIYVRRGTKVSGPFTLDQMKTSLRNGKLLETDLFATSNAGPWSAITDFVANLKRQSEPNQQAQATSQQRRCPKCNFILHPITNRCAKCIHQANVRTANTVTFSFLGIGCVFLAIGGVMLLITIAFFSKVLTDMQFN